MTTKLIKSLIVSLSALCLSAPLSAEESTAYEITDYRAANTPVNYSYVTLSVGKKEIVGIDDKYTALGARLQALLNEKFIFKIGYEASLADDELMISDLNKADIGLGFRYPLFESTDIEVDGRLLYNWVSEDEDIAGSEDDAELGYSAGLYIHQGIGDSFEGTLGYTYSSEFQEESNIIHLSITQYITEYVGVGLTGSITQTGDYEFSDQAYIGAHLRLNFY